MATEVKVPTLGESITEGTLAEWLKQPGDAVAQDEAIASLETDKVSVEVPSPVAGVMGEQKVAAGDTVAVGAVIASIEEGGAAVSAPAVAAAEPEPESSKAPAPNPQLREDAAPPSSRLRRGRQRRRRSRPCRPAVRRAVLEHHLDPTKIKGTGRDGRLTKDDVLAAAAREPVPRRRPGSRRRGESSRAGQPGSAAWAPACAGEQGARKNASRCRGFARPSPSGSRKRRTTPRC